MPKSSLRGASTFLLHPHRCVLCNRRERVACPDANAKECAVVCRRCASVLTEAFDAHRLEKGERS